jgi:predicted nucleotidyltransferase
MGKDYFIRFVKDWNEVNAKYGDIRYKKIGYATVKATITDDSEAIFTPCKYEIDEVETLEGVQVESLLEVASFRGRFCEQARIGETVIARGKIEKVIMRQKEYHRILLGGTVDSFMKLC